MRRPVRSAVDAKIRLHGAVGTVEEVNGSDKAAWKIQARRGSDSEQERSVKIFGSQRVFDVLSGRADVAEGWRDLSELLFRSMRSH